MQLIRANDVLGPLWDGELLHPDEYYVDGARNSVVLANIATTVYALRNPDGVDGERLWRTLDKHFPRPFIAFEPPEGPVPDSTFDLAVEIRTQHLIALVDACTTTDPLELLASVFVGNSGNYKNQHYSEDENTAASDGAAAEQAAALGPAYARLAGVDVDGAPHGELRDASGARVQQIQEIMAQAGPAGHVAALREAFPPAETSRDLLQWLKQCARNLVFYDEPEFDYRSESEHDFRGDKDGWEEADDGFSDLDSNGHDDDTDDSSSASPVPDDPMADAILLPIRPAGQVEHGSDTPLTAHMPGTLPQPHGQLSATAAPFTPRPANSGLTANFTTATHVAGTDSFGYQDSAFLHSSPAGPFPEAPDQQQHAATDSCHQAPVPENTIAVDFLRQYALMDRSWSNVYMLPPPSPPSLLVAGDRPMDAIMPTSFVHGAQPPLSCYGTLGFGPDDDGEVALTIDHDYILRGMPQSFASAVFTQQDLLSSTVPADYQPWHSDPADSRAFSQPGQAIHE